MLQLKLIVTNGGQLSDKMEGDRTMKTIKCAHCGYEFNVDDILRSETDLWALCPNEEETEATCPICGEVFWIMGGYGPTYKTFKTLVELEES